jgi:hypothetical protein
MTIYATAGRLGGRAPSDVMPLEGDEAARSRADWSPLPVDMAAGGFGDHSGLLRGGVRACPAPGAAIRRDLSSDW